MATEYKATAPAQITRERFSEMLEILPPSRWFRGQHIESFHVCEHLSGELVMWFVRVGGTYWEFADDCNLSRAQIAKKVLEVMP